MLVINGHILKYISEYVKIMKKDTEKEERKRKNNKNCQDLQMIFFNQPN